MYTCVYSRETAVQVVLQTLTNHKPLRTRERFALATFRFSKNQFEYLLKLRQITSSVWSLPVFV